MSTRLFAFEKLNNFSVYTLGGHTDEIVAVFFDADSLLCYTTSRNGHLAVWECSTESGDLQKWDGTKKIGGGRKKKKKSTAQDDSEEDDLAEDDGDKEQQRMTQEAAEEDPAATNFFYKRAARHFLKDHLPEDSKRAELTDADYHSKSKILVTTFSSGAFFILEMPDCNLIHSLSISDRQISTVRINPTGDWIAFGCQDLGQLLVWEWQSETFVLKQQGHFNNMACVGYSPDGQFIGTGGEDGKVKIWSTTSGFSFVTFSEHTSKVSGITFTSNAKVTIIKIEPYELCRHARLRS